MNQKELIHTDKAPAAVGPYSQAVAFGQMVFTSGQIGINPADGQVAEGFAQQAKQVLDNLGEVLKAGGASYDSVIKTTCFLADMGDFAEFNEIYSEYFKSKPARSCVAAKTLPKNVLVEVEAIAYRE